MELLAGRGDFNCRNALDIHAPIQAVGLALCAGSVARIAEH